MASLQVFFQQLEGLLRCHGVFVRSHYGGQRFANSEGSFRDGAAKITGLSCVGARSRIFWFFIRSFVVNIINQQGLLLFLPKVIFLMPKNIFRDNFSVYGVFVRK